MSKKRMETPVTAAVNGGRRIVIGLKGGTFCVAGASILTAGDG